MRLRLGQPVANVLRGIGAAAVLLLLACGAAPRRAPERLAPPAVLLISIDGMSVDYLNRGITPNLQRIIDSGVRAQWMSTSYPSLTFPNHYSMVTGLRPDRHGMVNNDMVDPQLGRFRLGDRDAVSNPAWWGGEPIWVRAERAGLETAAFFWPGTETPILGIHPRRWRPFDDSIPYDIRVDEVLSWLRVPMDQRPRFMTLYFEGVDKQGHAYGPNSAQTRQALIEADAAIGRLLDGMRSLGVLDEVNLVLVSDHGMAEVPPGQIVDIDTMVKRSDAALVSRGQSVGFNPLPGRTAAAEAQLLGRHERYECWRKLELPARWHYGAHPRVPAIICQMDEGWDALPRDFAVRRQVAGVRGSHGFDPDLPSMRTIFLARGPAFRRNAVIDPIQNVDVYPLLAHLLGLEPAPNDGDATALNGALQ